MAILVIFTHCNFGHKSALLGHKLMRNFEEINRPVHPKMIKQKNPKLIRKHAWKKGFCPNPKGRGASIPLTKVTRQYTTALVAEIYNKLIEKTRRELRSITIDPNAPALDVIIAKALLRDMRNSDQHHTNTVLARIIGPIPIRQEMSGAGGAPLVPPQIIVQGVDSPKTA